MLHRERTLNSAVCVKGSLDRSPKCAAQEFCFLCASPPHSPSYGRTREEEEEGGRTTIKVCDTYYRWPRETDNLKATLTHPAGDAYYNTFRAPQIAIALKNNKPA
ncbi:uncharacterized protein LOC125036348 [Penaeus chinensis]|uniref:uncharacterized protein LOC125036348 n=1 Tax=Penaeus chinensis TaxID=139456 RepID=UPI001FB6B874|nr:uncharacterized protein LOC125036348 [Penaeus chinensis]